MNLRLWSDFHIKDQGALDAFNYIIKRRLNASIIFPCRVLKYLQYILLGGIAVYAKMYATKT